MHVIVMDLIGKFKPSPQWHQYVFTGKEILMNYTWCIFLNTKEANEVVHAYLVNMHSKFGQLHKILSDN